MITYVNRDLIKVTKADGVIAIPINAAGIAEGVAKAITKKHPKNRAAFIPSQKPGSVTLIETSEATIANLVIQVYPGWPVVGNHGDSLADRMLFLSQAIKALGQLPPQPLYVPYKIGCWGPIGSWRTVHHLLANTSLDIRVAVPRWAVAGAEQKGYTVI